MDTGNLKTDLLAIKERAESFFSNAYEQCEEEKDDEYSGPQYLDQYLRSDLAQNIG